MTMETATDDHLATDVKFDEKNVECTEELRVHNEDNGEQRLFNGYKGKVLALTLNNHCKSWLESR